MKWEERRYRGMGEGVEQNASLIKITVFLISPLSKKNKAKLSMETLQSTAITEASTISLIIMIKANLFKRVR